MKIICLIGPSGSGKTTIGCYLSPQFPEIISHTTRKIRHGEIDGVSYHFVNDESFDKLEKIEEIIYAGNRYCISVEEIENKAQLSDTLFCIVTVDGYLALKNKYNKDIVISIYIDTDINSCISRMNERGDSWLNIEKRIKSFEENKEFQIKDECNYIFNNKPKFCSKEYFDEIHKMLNYINNFKK